MMTTSSRWVGLSIPIPEKERRPPANGRQRHYRAVELASTSTTTTRREDDDTGEKVSVDDVVEVVGSGGDATGIDSSSSSNDNNNNSSSGGGGSKQPGDSGRGLRLAQVLSMWEDTFTGVCKFHVRWLVHSSDIREAFARLQAARRVIADRKKNDRRSGSDEDNNGPRSPSWRVAERDDDADEVFLTSQREDVDIRFITKPVTVSLAIPTTLPTHLKDNKKGPLLAHTFDASTGDFSPVDPTDSIVKHPRARGAEAVEQASQLAEEALAANRAKVTKQSRGWLLPKRIKAKGNTSGGSGSSSGSGGLSSTTAAMSVCISESEGENSNSDGSNAREDVEPQSEAIEPRNEACHDASSDSTEADYCTLSDAPLREPARRRQPVDEEGMKRPRSSSDKEGVPVVAPPVQHLTDGSAVASGIKNEGPLRKRPRRLAMPHAQPLDRATSPTLSSPSPSELASSASPSSSPSKRQPSIRRLAPRSRTVKVATDKPVGAAHVSPRTTRTGDDFQVDIPDLLTVQERARANVATPPGTGGKMVWRSIRDWDQQSREMLSVYLRAAKLVMRKKQERPGVVVHVRLGGDAEKSSKKEGNNEKSKPSVANSFAAWAWTAGRSASREAQVACSEKAKTEVPVSAIQGVQCQEQALAALIQARCTLDDFAPALAILASDEFLPEGIEPWTLHQVRTLEQAIETAFDRDRRLHGWAREGKDMGRDDFMDLASVSSQVPGKTPNEVLYFYYKYLAAAEPLTDVVYGPQAAQARKLEPNVPARVVDPPAEASISDKAKDAAKNRAMTDRCARSPSTDTRNSQAARSPPKKQKSPTPSPRHSISRATGGATKGERLQHPAKHSRCPPTNDSTAGYHRPADVVYQSPPASSGVDNRYGSQRAARIRVGTSSPVQVDDRDEYSRGMYTTARSTAAVPALAAAEATTAAGAAAMHSRYFMAEAHARRQAGYEARVQPWGASQVRPPLETSGSLATSASGAPTNGTPTYRYVPTVTAQMDGAHLHEESRPSHSGSQPRRHLGEQQEGSKVGRAHARVVSNDGYPGYQVRRNDQPEAEMDDDDFSFMTPCWSLLEMAQVAVSQDQREYMRGLILKHVREPMTRDQLLERAESCFQDQPAMFAAFVSVFDGIHEVYAGANRATEMPPGYLAYRESVAAAARAAPPAGLTPGGHQHSPYDRAPVPRPYAVPPAATAVGRERDFPTGEGGSTESYSRVPVAAAVEARRHHQSVPPQAYGWDDVARGRSVSAVVGGKDPRPRQQPPPPPPAQYPPYSHPSAGPSARSVMMFHEKGGRGQGYHSGGHAVGAWPSQYHQQQPGQQNAHGGAAVSMPSAASRQTEQAQAHRRRMPRW